MPDWYYEKKELKNTPSYLAGLDYETETRYRREGARFIQEVGKALGLRHDTMATAAVYFHRFYMFHSFQEFPRYCAATCTMFLAGKAEETPKKCRDLIKTVRGLTNDAQFGSFGQDPREEVMTLERVLLQTIKFDLQVDHPYSSLLKYAKCLKGDKAKLQKMVQMSWTFVNDSLCTTLCLQWEPEVVAIALMYLAAKLSKFEVKDWKNRTPEHTAWWDQYVKDLDTEVLEDICHQVLDLYSQPTTEARLAPPSPPPGERKPPPPQPQAPAPPQHPAPPTQPPQPSQPPAPKPALPPSHPVAPQPRSAPPPGAPGYPQAPSYPVTAPPAPGYPPQTAPAPTGYPASAPYPAYAAVTAGYQAAYAAPQAGSHFPAQGATYGYPGQQAAGQVLPPAQLQPQVQGRPNGPPTPVTRGPPPSDNRPSRGPPSGDYRRGPPPAEHRGPPPDHRVPHSDSYHRSTPPEHRGGAPADHRGGPTDHRGGPPSDHRGGPPDHRGGPPHDGFRGGAPQDHRAPGDHRGGPHPDHRGGPPHDGFRGGAPPDHRGGAPADHRGGPPPDQRGGPPHDGFRGRNSYDRGSRGPPPRAAPPPPHRGSPYGRPPRSRGGGYGNSRY